jgi:hypothetical protein
MGAPHRRTIYIATLEAHIDCLHAQLLAIGLYPVPFERLEPFKGLNCKTAKVSHFLFLFSLLFVFDNTYIYGTVQSMVAGLQHDASHIKMKLLELERAVSCCDD